MFHQSAFSNTALPLTNTGGNLKSHTLYEAFFFLEKFGFFLDNYDWGNMLKIYKIPAKLKQKILLI